LLCDDGPSVTSGAKGIALIALGSGGFEDELNTHFAPLGFNCEDVFPKANEVPNVDPVGANKDEEVKLNVGPG
jgi:hypothetical protein